MMMVVVVVEGSGEEKKAKKNSLSQLSGRRRWWPPPSPQRPAQAATQARASLGTKRGSARLDPSSHFETARCVPASPLVAWYAGSSSSASNHAETRGYFSDPRILSFAAEEGSVAATRSSCGARERRELNNLLRFFFFKHKKTTKNLFLR